MRWDWKTTEQDEVYVDRHDGNGFKRPTLDLKFPGVAPKIARVEQWRELAQKIGKPNGAPLHWTLGVIYAESGGDPNAQSVINDLPGARGLMQVMPATAQALGYDPDTLFQPAPNIGAGTTLLGDFREKYDLPSSLSMYNAGPSNNGGPKKSLSSPWGLVENVGYIERATAAANYFRRKELDGTAPSPVAQNAPSMLMPLMVAGALYFAFNKKS